MEKRYLTILIISQTASKIRQIRIPSTFLKIASSVFALLILLASLMVYDYMDIKSDVGELDALRRATAKQMIQIRTFARKIGDLEKEMTRLRQFDKKLRIISNLEPPSRPRDNYGIGGSSLEDDFTINAGKGDHIVKQMHSDIEQLSLAARSQEKSFVELQEYLLEKASILLKTPSIWPTKGWLSSLFGYRTSPFTGLKVMHQGIDIANNIGTPVFSTAEGVVVKIGRDRNLGRYLVINHGRGINTRYGHLSKIFVKKRQRVKRREKIALMGNTGRSTGPHLHYEVIAKGRHVNPLRYILN